MSDYLNLEHKKSKIYVMKKKHKSQNGIVIPLGCIFSSVCVVSVLVYTYIQGRGGKKRGREEVRGEKEERYI